MKNIIFVMSLLLVSGCAMESQNDKITRIGITCEHYGFVKNTVPYANCIMNSVNQEKLNDSINSKYWIDKGNDMMYGY